MGPKRTRSLSNKTKKTNSIIIEAPTKVQKNTNAQKQNFKFITEEYSKYLTCPLCKQLMIQPQRFHPCAHTFCLSCIQHLQKIPKRFCPLQTCMSKCKQIQVDRTAQSLIDELKVACTNKGCQWKGEYDNFKKTHRDSCPLKGIGLQKYLQQLSRIPIIAHSNKDIQQQSQDEQKLNYNRRMVQSQHLFKDNYRFQQKVDENIDQIKQEKSHQLQQGQNDSNQIKLQIHQNNGQQEKVQASPVENEGQQQMPNIDFNKNQKKVQSSINGNFLQEKKQKQQSNQLSQQSQFIEQESHSVRRDNNNNNFIFINLPFGPPIQTQLRIEPLDKQKYLSKQLKKLQ